MDIRFPYAAFATQFCKYVRIIKHDSKHCCWNPAKGEQIFCDIKYNLHTECDKKSMHEIATKNAILYSKRW